MATHKVILKDGDKLVQVSRVPYTRIPAVIRLGNKVFKHSRYVNGKELPHKNSFTEYQLIQFP